MAIIARQTVFRAHPQKAVAILEDTSDPIVRETVCNGELFKLKILPRSGNAGRVLRTLILRRALGRDEQKAEACAQ